MKHTGPKAPPHVAFSTLPFYPSLSPIFITEYVSFVPLKMIRSIHRFISVDPRPDTDAVVSHNVPPVLQVSSEPYLARHYT